MKKLNVLKSAVTILAMVALVATATGAYFTADGSVTGNTFATGTLKLAVNKGANKPMVVSNWKPGDSITGWFDAYNYGTLEAEYWFYIANVSGSSDLKNALMIELRDGGYTGAGDGPIIYSGPLTGLIGTANMNKTSDNNVHAGSTAGGDNIRAGWTQRIYQKVWLPTTAGNNVMGKTLTFDEIVHATQDIDPDVIPVP